MACYQEIFLAFKMFKIGQKLAKLEEEANIRKKQKGVSGLCIKLPNGKY